MTGMLRSGAAQRTTQREVLRDPTFRRVIVATAVSATGDAFTTTALAFALLETGRGAAAVGTVYAARALGQILFMLPAGALVDRLPPSLIMLVSNMVRAVLQAAAGLLLLIGSAPTAALVVLYAGLGAAAAFYYPAPRTMIGTVLPAQSQQPANALLASVLSGPALVGPLMAGMMLTFCSPGVALLVDAASFLFAGLVMLGVRSATPRSMSALEHSPRVWLGQIGGGLREVMTRTWLAVGMGHAAVFQVLVLSSVTVLGPVVAAERYGGARSWALMLTVAAAGNLVGSLVALHWRPTRPLLATYVVVLASSLALVSLAMGLPLTLVLAALFVYGVVLCLGDTLWSTVVQTRVPVERLGRVISIDGFISNGLRPVGLAAIGVIAASLGTRPVLLAGALGAALVTALVVVLPSTRLKSTR